MKKNPKQDLPNEINTLSHLGYLLKLKPRSLEAVCSDFKKYYKPFNIVINGKKRRIERPVGELLHVQNKIQDKLLRKVEFPNTMLGGIKGRGLRDHAEFHLRRPAVVTLDIKDCFPNTKHTQIFGVYRNAFGCSNDIANLLTRLTTYNSHVPQGAPTSTLLVNLSLLDMHKELVEYAAPYGLQLTFWVDDITISGDDAQEHLYKLVEIIMKHGHSIRHKKIKIMYANEPQIVTGLLVNKVASIPKETRKKYVTSLKKLQSVTGEDRNKLELKVLGQLGFVGYINTAQGKQMVKLKS